MMIAGICKSPRDRQGDTFDAAKAMTFASMKALAGVLGPHPPILRTGDALFRLFPTPTTVDFDALDYLVAVAVSAGWRVLIDPAYPPAWATGGKGSYIGSVEGSSCQILAQWGVRREVWPLAYVVMLRPHNGARGEIAELADLFLGEPGLTNTPEKIAWHFVENYRGEQGGAQAWDVPERPNGLVHIWGDPRFVEQDKLSAPRPELLSAATIPHVDPKAMAYMAEALIERYGSVAEFFGVSINEPDIADFLPLIRFDIVNGGDGGRVIEDRLIPEQIVPYIGGLRRAIAMLPSSRRAPRILGPNVAYAGTLPRFSDLRRLIDVDGNHLYGDASRYPESSYEDARSYAQQAKGTRAPWGCSEFDHPEAAKWLSGLLALGLDPAPQYVIFYSGERFIDGWGEGGAEPNQEGRDMSKLLQQVNSRIKAAKS